MSNAINPEHYNRLNPQPKDVIRAWGLNFNLGSAVKYISRAGHKDDIVQDLKKAQEFIQFEIDAIEGARAERKDKPKHEDFMDAMLRGLFGGSVGHIEITGKRNGKTDEEIAEIVDKTIKDIISGMAGVELEEIKEGNGYTEVHILGTRYSIRIIDEDDYRYDREADGWCDPSVKEILIFNYKQSAESVKDLIAYQKKVLRHEIVHAFLYESGLWQNAYGSKCWAKNEEMIDWMAIQIPKIQRAYKEAYCDE